jgi:hypothetical protein
MKKHIIILISLLFFVTYVFAGTIIVTSSADSGQGSLREAITNASGNDVIVFAKDIETIILLTGSLRVEKNLTINGNENNNPTIKVQTGSTYLSFGHFSITENINVTLNNLTLSNGNHMMSCGGTIYNKGNLTINNCSFLNNKAKTSGVIHNVDVGANLTIIGSYFDGNSSQTSGGTISTGAKATITNCCFKNNSAEQGGAIHNAITGYGTSGNLEITNCIFENNIANKGAAISNNGKCTITNSLIFGNKDNAGAVYNYGWSERTAILSVVNSTIINNKIGLYIDNNFLTATTFQNCIFWENTLNDVFIKNNDGVVIQSNNLIGEDPLFGTNGYSLQEDSPAIDAGNNTYLTDGVTKDLAGNARIRNNTVDMGAYEFQYGSSTGIENASAITTKIYTRPHTIIVENAISPVSIYNPTGQLITQGTHTEFSVPTAGIYIVRVGNHVEKVIVP